MRHHRRIALGTLVVIAIGSTLLGAVLASRSFGASRQRAGKQAAVCAPQTTHHGPPTVDVGSAPSAEAGLIRASDEKVGSDLVTAIRLGDPPDTEFTPLDGYPGDRWLYINVAIGDAQGCRVEQDWEAARLAGDVRNAAATAQLPIPFGYSVIGVLPDGSLLPAVSIAIGAPIGTEPAATHDRAAEVARLQGAAAANGLQVTSLGFTGTDGAVIVRLQATGSPNDVVLQFPEIVQQLLGDRPDSAWLLEIDGPDGTPIEALANSPSTAGANGWVRPDLRQLDVDSGNAS
jgi:hypothetical protein